MSEHFSLTVHDLERAVAWNRKNVDLDELERIPAAAEKDYPLLFTCLRAPDSLSPVDWWNYATNAISFTEEVASVQEEANGKAGPVDGMYGDRTEAYLIGRYTPSSEAWIVEGQPFVSHRVRSSSMRRLNFREDAFWKLDKFSRRQGTVCRFIVVHWGGRDPRNLQRYFSSTDRSVSSHGSVGYDTNGSVIAAQTIDLADVSWHGGWINRYSVGMDIAFSPVVSRKDYGIARGWPINIIDNPTDRGDKQVIDLPDELARATAELLLDWADALSIPPKWVSRDPGALLEKDEVLSSPGGFIMHSQYDAGKWDCAPWGQKLMDATDKLSVA